MLIRRSLSVGRLLARDPAVGCSHWHRGHRRLFAAHSSLQDRTRRGLGSPAELRENIATVPNALSLARIALTPVLGGCVLYGYDGAAAGLFVFAGVSDFLDGQIARRWPSQASVFGSVLDPVADKLLVGTAFGCLTATGAIPLPLTALVLSRDLGLIAVALYLRYKSLPSPRSVSRFFDASLPSLEASPTAASKANTGLQLAFVAATLAAPLLSAHGHPLLDMAAWAVAGSTVGSGLSYVFAKGTYRLLAAN